MTLDLDAMKNRALTECDDQLAKADILALIAKVRHLQSERECARAAADELVKLQSHYATLLNQYDGGQRIAFKSVDEFIERLRSLSVPQAQGGNNG